MLIKKNEASVVGTDTAADLASALIWEMLVFPVDLEVDLCID